MKNLFTEHRYVYFGSGPEQNNAADAGPESMAPKIDTPEAAARDIKQAIDKADDATKQELARMGVKVETPVKQESTDDKKPTEKSDNKNDNDKVENEEKTEKENRLSEGLQEFAKALAELLKALAEAFKEFKSVKNNSSNERSENSSEKPALGEPNSINANLTEKEAEAVKKFRNKEQTTPEEQNDQTREKVQSLNKEKTDLRANENNLETQKDQLQAQLDTEELNTPPNSETVAKLKEQIGRIDTELQQVRPRIQSVDSQIAEAKNDKARSEQVDPDLESAKNKLQKSVDAINAKLESAANTIKNPDAQAMLRGITASLNPETLDIEVTVNADALSKLESVAKQLNIPPFTGVDSTGKVSDVGALLNFVEQLNNAIESQNKKGNDNNSEKSEQKEKTPRQALVETAKQAMQVDAKLTTNMNRVFSYFETQNSPMPSTYKELEKTQPGVCYAMEASSAAINQYAFDVAKIDGATIAAARETIQANPQGTYNFIKEVMQTPASTTQRESFVSTQKEAPATVSTRPPETTALKPEAVTAVPTPAPVEPVLLAQNRDTVAPAPTPTETVVGNNDSTTPAPKEENSGINTESVQQLKNALGELANNVVVDSNGTIQINAQSASDNELVQKGILAGLNALNIQHSNGVITVNNENIGIVISQAESLSSLVQNLKDGNFADVPEEVTQNIISGIDEKLPANMRGKLSIKDGNILFAGGDVLQKLYVKIAIQKAGLQTNEGGSLVITPKDIAKVVTTLTAISPFMNRQQA
jgi:hypothetical protein